MFKMMLGGGGGKRAMIKKVVANARAGRLERRALKIRASALRG